MQNEFLLAFGNINIILYRDDVLLTFCNPLFSISSILSYNKIELCLRIQGKLGKV